MDIIIAPSAKHVIFRALRDYLLVPILDAILRRKSYSDITRKPIPTIEFIGLRDTVAAYGLPIDEMTRGISNWVWPLELPNRILSERVNVARHALALDDERTTITRCFGESGNPVNRCPLFPQLSMAKS